MHYKHPTSDVHKSCEIGEGTKIWHFCHIMQGAKIGKDCILGQNVFVARGVKIGNGVKVQNNVSLYEGVILEDDVFCGPSCVLTNVLTPRSHVSRKNEFAPTRIKKGATIGANATIVCGNTVGRYAFIGAGAVVTHDIPDYALVIGMPAKIVGWMCRCGEKLAFKARCAACKRCGAKYVKQQKGLKSLG
jgi:UDP-2-acetamido-3-amino-2,3-dideoxy-glucuronate N-acetyltransferase